MVQIKPLEWEVYPDDGTRMFEGQNEQRQYISRALPPIGPAIFIMKKDDVYSIEDREGIYGTESDAKLVAQTDYELRILSALTLKDDPGNGAEGWQTIDSAPKDRTIVILWAEAWLHPVMGYWSSVHNGWLEYGSRDLKANAATHWLVMPESPRAAALSQHRKGGENG
jgi:hypothetical protein